MDPTQQIESLQNTVKDLQTQVDVLNTQGNNYDDSRPNLFDVFGTFQTITQAPTVVPSTPYDQLQLVNLSGTIYLYIYDTVGAAWKRVQLT